MACRRQQCSRWLLTLLAVSVLLGLLITPRLLAHAAAAEMLVTTDYLVSHTSSEPFYAQYKLDPQVVLHVREVVLAGRERTAPKDGKVVLLLHGGTAPGFVAFDLDHEQCSLMRYLARAGWDTFTLDFEGYGLSTRPLVMDVPAAFPQSSAPIHSEVAVHNVERAVEFIRALRGVTQVALLGWSISASREAPLYTLRHPEKVAKLVLWAPGYKNLGFLEGARARADALETKDKVIYSRPTVEGLYQFGSKEELLVPGAFEAFRAAVLASDPKSGELGGVFRAPAGRSVDQFRANPQFDAAKITVPTLVIRGALDTFGTREDSQLLTAELGSEVKQYVDIPNASHFVHYEKANVQFFKAIKDFLDAKVEKKQ
jgi:pimeloyl-ACP methyl ester carboxylesterase